MNSDSNINLENLYPAIYKELYPFVVEGVNELMRTGRVTVESVNRMTDEIIIKCGMWDEDGYSVYGFDPWFNKAEVSIDDAEIFNDAEFVVARPQPQKPPQNKPPQRIQQGRHPQRPSQRPPQRLYRPGVCIGRGCHNRNTLRDLLRILILREIIKN